MYSRNVSRQVESKKTIRGCDILVITFSSEPLVRNDLQDILLAREHELIVVGVGNFR